MAPYLFVQNFFIDLTIDIFSFIDLISHWLAFVIVPCNGGEFPAVCRLPGTCFEDHYWTFSLLSRKD